MENTKHSISCAISTNLTISELESMKASKRSDIAKLDELIKIEENKKYADYIGKYFKLSATSICRVDVIEYITECNINFTGLHIHGGTKHTDEFRIHISDHNQISRLSPNQEITKEQFIQYMNTWHQEHKEYIIGLLF